MQDKLDREATALKEQMSTENEKRMNESKALQDKLEKEKEALATQMQSGSKELEEKMAREEELRRQEAEAMKVTSKYLPRFRFGKFLSNLLYPVIQFLSPKSS